MDQFLFQQKEKKKWTIPYKKERVRDCMSLSLGSLAFFSQILNIISSIQRHHINGKQNKIDKKIPYVHHSPAWKCKNIQSRDKLKWNPYGVTNDENCLKPVRLPFGYKILTKKNILKSLSPFGYKFFFITKFSPFYLILHSQTPVSHSLSLSPFLLFTLAETRLLMKIDQPQRLLTKVDQPQRPITETRFLLLLVCILSFWML